MSDGKLYYLMVADQRVGPIALDAVRDLAAQGRLMPQTLMWTEGMETWLPLIQSPLGSLVATGSPPPPPVGGLARPAPASLYGADPRAGQGGPGSYGGPGGSGGPGGYGGAGGTHAGAGFAGVGFSPDMAPVLGISFVDAVKRAFSKYATFEGRASRSEYWWYSLFTIGVALVLALVFAPLYLLFALGTLLPSIAIGVRRLHDIDRTGWWMLFMFVPLVGPILLLVFFVMASTPGQNRFG